MNPFFSSQLAEQHIRDLQREAQAARIPEQPGEHGVPGALFSRLRHAVALRPRVP